MIINRANLDTLYTAYNGAFRAGVAATTRTYWSGVAMEVPSTTAKNLYPWLNQIPGIRKWTGDRQLQGISASKYELTNEDYEQSISVDRNNIEDDSYGIFTPLMQAMGEETGRFRDKLAFAALAAGFATACYDGQYFFDTDHPVLNAHGVVGATGSNFQGGSGTAWFLVDESRFVKPVIIQKRRDFTLTRDDADLFKQKKYTYGSDGRFVSGFGFWQYAYASKQTLNYDNYNSAIAAMIGLRGDYANPIGAMPTSLYVPATLRTAALEVVKRERLASGETNINQNTVEVKIVPYL